MTMTTSFNSIVQLEANGERSWWATERDAIRAALVDHYGADVAGEALTPPRDPAALRARLRGVPIPERFFLLYAVRAAQCGGEVSLLRDGRVVKSQLEETPEGRAAVRLFTESGRTGSGRESQIDPNMRLPRRARHWTPCGSNS